MNITKCHTSTIYLEQTEFSIADESLLFEKSTFSQQPRKVRIVEKETRKKYTENWKKTYKKLPRALYNYLDRGSFFPKLELHAAREH